MEQCDSKGCGAPAVFWGHCEAHLTEKERAVLELVQAVEDEMAVWEWKSEKRLRIRRAIAAVKV